MRRVAYLQRIVNENLTLQLFAGVNAGLRLAQLSLSVELLNMTHDEVSKLTTSNAIEQTSDDDLKILANHAHSLMLNSDHGVRLQMQDRLNAIRDRLAYNQSIKDRAKHSDDHWYNNPIVTFIIGIIGGVITFLLCEWIKYYYKLFQ